MDTLQADLRDNYPILNIQIVGVNAVGYESENDLMTANRTTPWLQDVDANVNQLSDVWYDSWDVTYRDVIIVDGQNETVDVYNLTANDLGVAANYATLRDKLLDAAMTEQKPWQNQRDRFDINDDGFVVPGDVLIMINEINANGPLELPPPTGTSLAAPYWDTSGDNFFSPVDILQVINFVEGANAEGEASGKSEPELTMIAIALPNSHSQELVTTELLQIEIGDSLPGAVAEPPLSAIVTRSELSTADHWRSIESASDDFWADYWPSL